MSKSILASVSIFVSHNGREGNLGNDTFPFQRQRYAEENIKEARLLRCKYFEFMYHCSHREPKAARPICDVAE